jgi:hypothetical protein
VDAAITASNEDNAVIDKITSVMLPLISNPSIRCSPKVRRKMMNATNIKPIKKWKDSAAMFYV